MLSNILARALKIHHKTTFRILNLMNNRLLLILSFLISDYRIMQQAVVLFSILTWGKTREGIL
jgi:hypothetical protein